MRFIAIPIIVLLIIIGVVAVNVFYTVNPAQQAIVLELGKVVTTQDEPGLKFKKPFIQHVVYVDKRVLDFDIDPEEVITSDQKRITVDIFIRYRITDALGFYRSVGSEAQLQGRMASILESKMREVLGRETIETILSGERRSLMERMRDSVNEESAVFGIDVIDVRIKRADLPRENSNAIFERMIAERQREAKEARAQGDEEALRIRSQADRERTVLLAEAKRDSEIIRGEGDAERNRIFAEAFSQDPEFFAFYRSMQAYQQSLSSDDTTLVLSPDSEFFRYFTDKAGVPPSGGQR